jgi:hypothetical protein
LFGYENRCPEPNNTSKFQVRASEADILCRKFDNIAVQFKVLVSDPCSLSQRAVDRSERKTRSLLVIPACGPPMSMKMFRFSNLSPGPTTLSYLSSRAYPDFLPHRSHQRPRMWFSLKRTTCNRPKPQLSTGNPGEPRDLRCARPSPIGPGLPLSTCLLLSPLSPRLLCYPS